MGNPELAYTKLEGEDTLVSAVFSADSVDKLTYLSKEEQDFLRWQMAPKDGTPKQAVLVLSPDTSNAKIVLGQSVDGAFSASHVHGLHAIGLDCSGTDIATEKLSFTLSPDGTPEQQGLKAFTTGINRALLEPALKSIKELLPPDVAKMLGMKDPMAHVTDEFVIPEDQHKANIRFDHHVSDILSKQDGIFLGEFHDKPAMVESVSKLMGRFKADGVTAVSYELPQVIFDRMAKFNSLDELKKECPNVGEEQLRPLFELSQACKQHGITLMGHENPQTLMHEEQFYGKAPPTEEQMGELMHKFRFAQTETGLNSRDAWSVAYIRENKPPGKVIVIGGAAHGKSQKTELDKNYGGISNRLGFVSVDAFGMFPGMKLSDVGQVYTTPGKSSDFIVGLPPSVVKTFKEMDITSWPPPPEDAKRTLPMPRLRFFILPIPVGPDAPLPPELKDLPPLPLPPLPRPRDELPPAPEPPDFEPVKRAPAPPLEIDDTTEVPETAPSTPLGIAPAERAKKLVGARR